MDSIRTHQKTIPLVARILEGERVMDTTITITLSGVTCYKCGVHFGMETKYQQARISDKYTWWCPNGHSQSYSGETDAVKVLELTKRLNREENDKAFYRTRTDELTQEVKLQTRRASAVKGQLTKLKRRTDNGVCPHCSRTVQQMARHIKRMHKDVDVQTVNEVSV